VVSLQLHTGIYIAIVYWVFYEDTAYLEQALISYTLADSPCNH
jgi:hypothetical protein